MKNIYNIKEEQSEIKTSHPSYGTLSFKRKIDKSTFLFGSDVEHRDKIIMRLCHADIIKGLYNDKIMGNKVIAEVEMSFTQFAEIISSINIDIEVPVTIKQTEMDGDIKQCKFIDKKEWFKNRFKERRQKIKRDSQIIINDIIETFDGKNTFSKIDKALIVSKLNTLNDDINTNMDFISEQFNKDIDKIIKEIESEIEGFIQNKINFINYLSNFEEKEKELL